MGNDPETGEPITLDTWIDRLAPNALAVVAAGIKVSIELLRGRLDVSDWVLIHVGFAMSKISAEQAGEQVQLLHSLGETQEALEEGQGLRHGTRARPKQSSRAQSSRAVPHLRTNRWRAMTDATERTEPPGLRTYGACTLGDDGYTTCGDVGVPVRVLRLWEAGQALCEDRAGERAEIATDFAPEPAPGDVLLVHMGVAIAHLRPSSDPFPIDR